jgi:hypothetical protein
MRNHLEAFVEVYEEELAVSSDRLDTTAGQTILDLLGRGVVPGGAFAADRDPVQPPADHGLFEMTASYLDFWKLGQARSPGRGELP